MQLEELKALVVKPGDLVIFTVPEHVSVGHVAQFKKEVDSLLPDGVRAIVLVNAEVAGVRSADA